MPQLQETANEFLAKTIEGATKTGEFLVGQIPDVVQQLLAWKFALYTIWSSVGLVGTLVTLFLWHLSRKKEKRFHIDDFDGRDFLFCIISLGSIGLFLGNMFMAVKVWIAPKVYLIEYAASLLSGNG